MGIVKKGDVVAKEGAWQRKYLVENVTRLAEEKQGHMTVYQIVVALKPLGAYYAHSGTGKASSAPVREVLEPWYVYEHEPAPEPDTAELRWYKTDAANTYRYKRDGSL